MAFDILAQSPAPLHIAHLIAAIEARFGLRIDSESLVSALSKRVARRDRFTRVARNTFGLIPVVGHDAQQTAGSQEGLSPASKKKTAARKTSSEEHPHES